MSRTAVCPWWAGYTLNNRFRRLVHNPPRILSGLVGPGMTALDIGCGMGYFTLPLAELVGPDGDVVAVDLQEKMLAGMGVGARRRGLEQRITAHRCRSNALDLAAWEGRGDFALLFMMLHEVPDAPRLIDELHRALRPGGRVLFAEPVGHVRAGEYRASLQRFRRAGFAVQAAPPVAVCRAAVLVKTP